eukprot:2890719-Rhodomonas_salina.5
MAQQSTYMLLSNLRPMPVNLISSKYNTSTDLPNLERPLDRFASVVDELADVDEHVSDKDLLARRVLCHRAHIPARRQFPVNQLAICDCALNTELHDVISAQVVEEQRQKGR